MRKPRRADSILLLLPSSGASGVLGSAVYDAFVNTKHTVVGLAFSRASDKLKKVDLLNQEETSAVIQEFRPDCKAPLFLSYWLWIVKSTRTL
jgi:hypothetical protein